MSTTDTDPERIIADAEQEAKEAESLVHTLEEAVKSGDESVTFEQVEKARGLLSFVRLRKEAATRKAAAAKEAARLDACEALKADIVAHAQGDGKAFSKHLRTAVDALGAFHDAVEERNARIREYRDRAIALGIPEHKHTGPTPPTHGGVRLAAGGSAGLHAGVVVGRRRVESFDADVWISRALDLLVRDGKLKILDHIDAGRISSVTSNVSTQKPPRVPPGTSIAAREAPCSARTTRSPTKRSSATT
ncbi:hypothetical protein AHiyo1_01280 [Arthrobacter sp. Hiyo1]|uniref:hypothetical protein n=1 Tax=Arthrobacter sp. Hiyo1 TaxID=1588020 RepID=UPI0007232DCA|nr:hypothetical protein [Arthrobacter sp. Hiyo1]GAP57303.1 hypothetical protein AHiyo1_01280 [Arthrobacter sp. Hiyo1]